MSKTFHERRKELGLTLEEIGQQVGVGKSTVRKWETGMIENMKRDKIVALAKILQVSPVSIVDNDFTGIEELDVKPNITTLYNQLEPPRQDSVYNYATEQLNEQQYGIMPLCETVSVYGYASAGAGEILQDESVEEINYTGTIPKHDYALYVNGDSMLPLFSDGQLIFIKKDVEPYNNQIVIANYNGDGFVKKFVKDDNSVKLISLNKKYDDIVVNEHDEFRILGVVAL